MPTTGIPFEISIPAIKRLASLAHAAWLDNKSAENDRRIRSFGVPAKPGEATHKAELTTRPVELKTTRSLIAVVDDEQVIAITLAEILIGRGFDAVWFTVPTEALNFAATCRLDVLLTDISMPVLDGITLAANVLRLRSDCIILLLSAQSHEPEVRRRAQSLNAGLHLLAKPIKAPVLVEKINRLLGASRQEGQFVVSPLTFPMSMSQRRRAIIAAPDRYSRGHFLLPPA